jgi:hypothetical protein
MVGCSAAASRPLRLTGRVRRWFPHRDELAVDDDPPPRDLDVVHDQPPQLHHVVVAADGQRQADRDEVVRDSRTPRAWRRWRARIGPDFGPTLEK